MGYEEVREIIGPKRTLEILELLEEESPLNYSAILREVPTSTDVLSDRLDLLTEYGLVSKQERSKKDVRYSITELGEEFLRTTNDLSELIEE